MPCARVQVMTHVVDALGAGKGNELDQVCLSMVDVATKVGSEEAVRDDWLILRTYLRHPFMIECCDRLDAPICLMCLFFT